MTAPRLESTVAELTFNRVLKRTSVDRCRLRLLRSVDAGVLFGETGSTAYAKGSPAKLQK
jgi:hypothetical protein